MGLFSAVFGAPAKAKFIRSLIARRAVGVDGVVEAGLHHDLLKRIDALSFAEVMATPEATLVTIVESLVVLSRQGVPMPAAIRRINAFRNGAVMVEAPEEVLSDLRSFLVFRVLSEHGTRVPGIAAHWFDEFVPEVFERYGVRVDFDPPVPELSRRPAKPPPEPIPPAPAPPPMAEVADDLRRYAMSCPACQSVILAEIGARPHRVRCKDCAHEFMTNEAFGLRRL